MSSCMGVLGILFASAIFASGAAWAGGEPIQLPKPRTEGGMPLMEALSKRASGREYSEKELSLQTLSNLLWAAAGINRPESGKRTVPSAMDWQSVSVYAVLKTGAYRYDEKANVLAPVAEGDLRALTGTQDFPALAPLNLVFIADYDRMKGVSGDGAWALASAEMGFISQNVYLFCASEGLSTVVRGLVDRKALGQALNLSESQKVVYAQSVGYPKGE